ncbi:MAG: phosphoglycerate dehydrogenase [Candidatus Faecivivens sp.]|nr:phosphoglycerate dehydrogenase [Oscillospiraceae bacterium]MDY2712012.1 phosphoglycerate dehydrogenase [Candidatus Faecivivens sp.]
MQQILTLNKISPIGLEKFDRSRYTWGENVEAPDAVLVRSASMHDMPLPPSVKAIARAGAGVNNIPLDECARKGIAVFNTPGANANAVKEITILGLLMASRKVASSMEWVKTLKGSGDETAKKIEKGKGAFTGPEIKGKKLGVIGLGAIGVLVANAAAGLGMTVYGYDPYLSVDAAWSMSASIYHAKTLGDIYENCDYITLHLPCTGETKGMINASSIATMKNGVRLLNFARGELVVTEDLLEAVEQKKISCYVTDFPADEMIGRENIVALPHLGASTPESEDNCAVMAVAELTDYLETGNIVHSVNLPNVSLPRSAGMPRVCVVHLNVSGLINKLTAVISEAGGNIENMISGSRKEYAYTMFDLSGNIPADLAEKLDQVPNVIRSRII